jgi:hypothetical protein
MSKDIFETEDLQVTAFVGGKRMGNNCIQIGLKGNAKFAQLNERQALELAHALLSRCLNISGYNATD